jgi:transposase
MRVDDRTKDYVERRTAEGLGKKEIIRCLKCYVAREVYRELIVAPDGPKG